MKTLLNIVAGLLLLVQSYRATKEQADAQKQADSISKDPVDWFNNHFDGGLQQHEQPTNTAEAKATKADDTRLKS